MLTAAEKQACRTVTRTDWRQAACYGTKEDGFCPIGAVAALRGVELYWWESRHHYSCLPEACCAVTGQRPRPMRRAEIANYDRFDAARRDVLTWVGFLNDEDGFTRALAAQGTALFPNEGCV